MFGNCYQGKTVLVTGHTGFKGTWLCTWLRLLGASRVIGLSNGIPTTPSMFEQLDVEADIEHIFGDVRDLSLLTSTLERYQPDFVFHLAAQAIVSVAHSNPIETITTNVIGTANILEALRLYSRACVAVIVTSDKCYENIEWLWGYRETDHLGGKDIYSGSKGCAEVIFHSYFETYFKDISSLIRLGTGRAGNVIGGGDWAHDRIVVDCVRSWAEGRPVKLRSPNSTRPWQHVLEPLSGYLTLGMHLSQTCKYSGQSYNFGPKSERNSTVLDLLTDLSAHWKGSASANNLFDLQANPKLHEAGLLKLNCDKALFDLKWEATLKYDECIEFVGAWYKLFSEGGSRSELRKLTEHQISTYQSSARERRIAWSI